MNPLPAFRHDGGGIDKFVGLSAGIGMIQPVYGVDCFMGRISAGDQVIGFLYPVPAVVPVHGVVASDN